MTNYSPEELDDAMLRMIFAQVAEDQKLWRKPMEAWKVLYDAVTTTEAAKTVLAHIADQEAEIARLHAELSEVYRTFPRPEKLVVR